MRTGSRFSDDDLARAWAKRFSSERTRVLIPGAADAQLKAAQQIDAETVWAFDSLDDLVTKDPAHAWAIVLQILDLAEKDEDVLSNLAAGPLESLLVRHGRTAIKWIEDEARRSPKFKDLLAGVWQSGVNELIWQRVQRALERDETD